MCSEAAAFSVFNLLPVVEPAIKQHDCLVDLDRWSVELVSGSFQSWHESSLILEVSSLARLQSWILSVGPDC